MTGKSKFPKLSSKGETRIFEVLSENSENYKAIYFGKFTTLEQIHAEICKIIEELAQTEGKAFVFDNHITLTPKDFVMDEEEESA